MDVPSDFVLATNETHSVREFVESAFACIGTTIEWQGERETVNEVRCLLVEIKNSLRQMLLTFYPHYRWE